MFTRSLVVSSSLFLALVITGCAADTTPEDPDSAEEDLTAGAPLGNFEVKPAANATFKADDLYRLELSKSTFDNKIYVNLQVLSPLCGKNQPTNTCPIAWVNKDDRALDQYSGEATINEATKTIVVNYELLDEDRTPTTRTFTYRKLRSGLKLTEGARVMTLPKAAPLPNAPAATMAALKAFVDEGHDLDREVQAQPPFNEIPISVRREAHFYDQQWGSDYPAGIGILPVGDEKLFMVSEMNDGGGSYVFFAKDGTWINSFGGSESGEWDWSR